MQRDVEGQLLVVVHLHLTDEGVPVVLGAGSGAATIAGTRHWDEEGRKTDGEGMGSNRGQRAERRVRVKLWFAMDGDGLGSVRALWAGLTWWTRPGWLMTVLYI